MTEDMTTGFIMALNEHRQSFENLCGACEVSGLPRPTMQPGPFENGWQVDIGEQRFTGSVGVCIDRAYYWVRGYRGLQEIQDSLEKKMRAGVETEIREHLQAIDAPVEVGEFRCTKNNCLRVEVTHVGPKRADVIFGQENNPGIVLVKESAGTLAEFFGRLHKQLDE